MIKKLINLKPTFNQKVLFIHIPKTAGTSFRNAFNEFVKIKSVLFDYSEKSTTTSKEIMEFIYEKKDFFLLQKYIDLQNSLFLSGHFHVEKYMSFFDTRNVISFVREPVSQVISHYTHHKEKLNYKKTLEEFIKEDRFSNIQSRMLSKKPLELYGFIGITEEYEKSLEIINHYFNTNIKIKKDNINNNSKKLKNELSIEVVNLIKEYNHKDIQLYINAKKLFQIHYQTYKSGKNYTYNYFDDLLDNSSGIAYKRNNEIIDVKINDNKILKANLFRNDMIYQGLPRAGYVGYGKIDEKTFFNQHTLEKMIEGKYKEPDYLRVITEILIKEKNYEYAAKIVTKALELRPNGHAIIKLKEHLENIREEENN